MKDGRGFWVGDYWGVISFGVNRAVVTNVPKTWNDLLKPEYKNKVALNGEPADVGLGRRRRLLGRARERRLADQHRPGDRLLRAAEGRRQLHPGAGDAADDRVGPDADHDRLGLPQPRLRQGVPVGEDRRGDPVDRRSTARTTARRSTRPAPHPWAARLWQEFLYSDAGSAALAEGLLAPGALRGPGAAQEDPEGAAERAAVGRALREREVRRAPAQQTKAATAVIATEWPAKVGVVAHWTAQIASEGLPRPARAGRAGVRRSPGSASLPFFAYAIALPLPAGRARAGRRVPGQGRRLSRSTTSRSSSTSPTARRTRTASRSASSPRSLGGLLGFLIAYAAIRDGTPRFVRAVLTTFSGVAANFAGIPLAFAFIATLGTIGVVTRVHDDQLGFNPYDHGFTLFSKTGRRARRTSTSRSR